MSPPRVCVCVCVCVRESVCVCLLEWGSQGRDCPEQQQVRIWWSGHVRTPGQGWPGGQGGMGGVHCPRFIPSPGGESHLS